MSFDAPARLAEKPLLGVLQGERPAVPPMWLMRQAGRYLPEYRALRAEKGGFLELVYDSEAAAEVTLQPLRRFGFDGAILFSDILIVPYAMGQDLWFEAGEGPRLAPILAETALSVLKPDFSRFEAVYETVRRVKAALDPHVTFLGFAGSPWTIATYMVAGQGSKDHGAARRMAYNEPDSFAALIDAIIDATVVYLSGQIQAGVEAVQLFDSWAGSLAPLQFERWVIEPNRRIVERLKALHPDVPVIGFPKGAGAKLADYAARTGVDAIGVDETIDPHWANRALPQGMPVQGNLDPLALIAGGRAVEEAVDTIRAAFADRPHIFNLGHGILPDTPLSHVEALIRHVRQRGVRD
ncbi:MULTISPECIES: uroporphyrinogen decarboxylase [unclassified Sphingobium]|uniref:uroporphyrinogen decarboxylase n=1 Tax=unclassified Sphingobium TaxID=2611147 RepID=UPI0007F54CD2|nr:MULTISPECIES: uroporphyrinogen decarboxylase [unclassified Sphingobium]OAN50996.1 uroporphyrinogen decarboxylase [Sphingobium sp. TCM1]WIW88130.1 uroporphyrinogen decarboxylase [Sphingobium sp. V4]